MLFLLRSFTEKDSPGNISRNWRAFRVEYVIDARYKELFTTDRHRDGLQRKNEYQFGYYHVKRSAEVTTKVFSSKKR